MLLRIQSTPIDHLTHITFLITIILYLFICCAYYVRIREIYIQTNIFKRGIFTAPDRRRRRTAIARLSRVSRVRYSRIESSSRYARSSAAADSGKLRCTSVKVVQFANGLASGCLITSARRTRRKSGEKSRPRDDSAPHSAIVARPDSTDRRRTP